MKADNNFVNGGGKGFVNGGNRGFSWSYSLTFLSLSPLDAQEFSLKGCRYVSHCLMLLLQFTYNFSFI